MFLVIIFSFLAFILIPDVAHAWGPATHLELGYSVLENSKLLAPQIRALLMTFPYDFLYGNVSADIVVGKNLVEDLKHCHNWKIGFKVLHNAQNDAQRAFAYGYLSHLAADTIAHNNYIPVMMIRSFSTRTLRHIYWELRFDALADKKIWDIPQRLIRKAHPENDRLLDSVIEDTPLSFKTNKSIFSSMLSLQRFKQWHRMLALLSASSQWMIEKEEKEAYFNASFKSIIELLNTAQRAQCVKKDPTGKHSLNAAKHMRKRLKTIRRQGKDWEGAMDNALKWVKL